MKIENIWDAIALTVTILFSVILWFSWLGTQEYTIPRAIETTISWLLGVIILNVGATLIDFSGSKVKSSLGFEETDIWEALATIITILVTIILWFSWLGAQDWAIFGVITTAITWIVVVLIVNLSSIFIGYFQSKFKEALK